ncbi:MAG: minichromosome maintenance protein MCM [Methanosarcinales archaeon]|nr:MAG: minichromosome maintenance protein MCM [Methanosarcinales archaeon]
MSAHSSPQKWTEFLKSSYKDEIANLAEEYPDVRSLSISFFDIEQFDPELADELLNLPDEVLRDSNQALLDIGDTKGVDFSKAYLRVRDLASHVQIRSIRSHHIGKMIAVEGLIRKATEVRPKITRAVFHCPYEHETVVMQGEKFVEPYECNDANCSRKKGPFALSREKSTFLDAQKIRIQESPEGLRGGEQPQTLDVLVVDDLAGITAPGDRIIITGVLRSYQRVNYNTKTTFFDIVLDGLSIDVEDKEFEDIVLASEDIEMIKTLAADTGIYEKIIRSIAPSIYGYSEVKEAISLQLMSGVSKKLPDGSRIRGDIHMLLIGDPGIAKSQLLRYTVKIAPRGIYTSGKSSTSAGLTAAAVKDEFGDGRWTLEAGALVLADKGIAGVDEMDKMKPDDRASLHEAMEQQTISIAKAGIMATLQSRCSLLGAANPKYGRFDQYDNIAKQINMPPTLLSRFDLIFILTDKPTIERDTQISNHILKAHYAGELSMQQEHIPNSGITSKQIEHAMKVIQPEIEPELMRKYIAYAKRNIYPLMSDDAREKIINFYLGLRKQGEDPNSPVPVTARQLEALVRLAESSARIRLSNEVNVDDIERVIRIVTTSLEQVMMDPETGMLDADIISVGTSKSQRDKIHILRDIIKELQHAHDGVAPYEDVIVHAEEQGINREKVEDVLSKLKNSGEIYEPKNGYVKISQ